MQNIFKSFLVIVSLFIFSVSLSAAEPRVKGRHIERSDLPKNYSWYVVSSKKLASELLQGNLRKTSQIFTEKQGAITVGIENHEDGVSAFLIAFNDIEEPSVTITFDKPTVASFLKGDDPRKGYEEPVKLMVRDNILYLGLLKTYFRIQD